jgi:Putative Flp pilus-assembly TadE/G-like
LPIDQYKSDSRIRLGVIWQVLINYFIFLTTLFLFCGLALDAGLMQLRKLQLQHAADAAALGAMYEAGRGNAGWLAAGKADAALNGFTDGLNGVTVTIVNPPTTGAYTGDVSAYQAALSQRFHANFVQLIVKGTLSVGASAVSKPGASKYCVYVMNTNPSASDYTLSQSSGTLNASCGIFVNSNTWNISNNSSSTLKATTGTIDVVGPASDAKELGTISPAANHGVSNQTDPLSSLTQPTYGSCNHTNYSVPLFWTVTLSPGTYCGSSLFIIHTPGITVNLGANVTFQPGLYIITGGMNFANAASVKGAGVTFFFTDDASGYYGQFVINSTPTTLSAPTSSASGGIPGILVFGDRNWNAIQDQDFRIMSSYVTADGVWYTTNTGIYNSSSTLTAPNYLALVTDSISSSSGTFTIPSPNFSSVSGGSPLTGTSGGLVQ